MRPRQQRMLAVGLVVVGVAIATGLTLQAMKDSMMFFVSVTEVRRRQISGQSQFPGRWAGQGRQRDAGRRVSRDELPRDRPAL